MYKKKEKKTLKETKTVWRSWCSWWNRFLLGLTAAFLQQRCNVSLTQSQTQVCLCAWTHMACQTGVTHVSTNHKRENSLSRRHDLWLFTLELSLRCDFFIFNPLSCLKEENSLEDFSLWSACCVVDCLQNSHWQLPFAERRFSCTVSKTIYLSLAMDRFYNLIISLAEVNFAKKKKSFTRKKLDNTRR